MGLIRRFQGGRKGRTFMSVVIGVTVVRSSTWHCMTTNRYKLTAVFRIFATNKATKIGA